MTRYRDEPNIWRTIISIAITSILLFGSIYVIDNVIFVEDEPEPTSVINFDITHLLKNKEIYITPDDVEQFTFNILNNTKDLNTSDYITIYRYLRENFDQSDSFDQPRPPVETISRGYGSVLDLSLLYTSVLIHLGYNGYTAISDEMVVPILFKDQLIYLFDFVYYSPLEIKEPVSFVTRDIMHNVTVISDQYARHFDDNFYTWFREELRETR